jgi:hypothetical protein
VRDSRELHRQLHPERNDNSPVLDPLWVVWSEEHRGWWGPGRVGYTPSLEHAGRYSQADAVAIEHRANRYLPAGTYNEIAMPDPLPAWRARAPKEE